MSETLAGQAGKSLGEMPRALEMGELRKMTTLQDIPLAEGISMQELKPSHRRAEEENERKLKTSSLKRFLRLPSKKKFAAGSLEEIDFKKVDVREEALQSPKRLSGSLSKAALKSSLSSYWNSMFKSKKTGKSMNEVGSDQPEASSSFNMENLSSTVALQNKVAGVEEVKHVLVEEIQSLNISQECPPK